MTVAELRARFLAMHPADKVRRAEDAALFACALAVYERAVARRELAQGALLDALESEREWTAIVHGLALSYARSVDADESPAVARSLSDRNAKDSQ